MSFFGQEHLENKKQFYSNLSVTGGVNSSEEKGVNVISTKKIVQNIFSLN